MSIAVGIVAHASRIPAVRELRRVTTPVAVNVDDGTLGCEGNHLVVLKALMYRHVDWCVVLEDDAQPVRDFRLHVKQALAYAPEPIVGLYLGYGNPSGETQRQTGLAARTAAAQDKAWIVGDALIGSVGYAIRIRLIEPMLADIAQLGYELPLRITRWAQSQNIGVCYTAPSLVDHADGDPIGYLPEEMTELRRAGVADAVRKAWNVGTRDHWDTGAVVLGYCPGWSRPPQAEAQ